MGKNYQGVPNFLIEVGKNSIPGESLLNAFACNPSVGTTTDPETVWPKGGLYDFYPSAPQNMEAVSASPDDTGELVASGVASRGSLITLVDTSADFLADGVEVLDLLINDTTAELAIITSVTENVLGCVSMDNGSQVAPASTPNGKGDQYRVAHANSTGAAAVVVSGLGGNWLLQNEVVILDGETPVPLAKTYLRQYRAYVAIAASRAGAHGSVEIRIAGDGAVASYILLGANITQQAVFTIPADSTGSFLASYHAVGKGVGGAVISGLFTINAARFGGPSFINQEVEVVNSGSGYWAQRYRGAPPLAPMTDIEIICKEVSGTTRIQSGMSVLVSKV